MNRDYLRRKICNEKFWNTYFKDFQIDNHEMKNFNPIIFKYDNRFKNHLPVYKVIVKREEGNEDYFYVYFSDFYIYIGKINQELPNSIFEYFGVYYENVWLTDKSCPYSYLPPTNIAAVNGVWLTYVFDKFVSLIQGTVSGMDEYWKRKHKFKNNFKKSIDDFSVTTILTLGDKLPIEIIYIILEEIKIIDMLII